LISRAEFVDIIKEKRISTLLKSIIFVKTEEIMGSINRGSINSEAKIGCYYQRIGMEILFT
jgi:hypothetical protein